MKASVTELPFNNFLGIHPAHDTAHPLQLPSGSQYLNHLGQVHAAAQLALAEASSGELLLRLLDPLTIFFRSCDVWRQIPQACEWQHSVHCECSVRSSHSARRGAFFEKPFDDFNYTRDLRRIECTYAFRDV
jgi:hypothetical protein